MTKQEAEQTAEALGRSNHSVYGVYRKDDEGYTLDVCDYFVERDLNAMPDRIFGMTWEEIKRKQAKL